MTPPQRPTASDQTALAALQAGRLAEAVTLCDTALHADPRSEQAYLVKAEALRVGGRPNLADATLLAGAAHCPGATLPLALGRLRLVVNDTAGAAAALAYAVARAPDNAEAHAFYGMALRGVGRSADAVVQYQAALDLAPGLDDARHNLGFALIDLGRYAEARDTFHTLVERRPADPDARQGLGLAYDWLGDLGNAEAAYAAGLRFAPDHHGLQNNIASVYLAQNRFDDALTAFDRAARLKNDHDRPVEGGRQMLLHRVRHDAEQLRYLSDRVALDHAARDCLAVLESLEMRHAGQPGIERIPVEPALAARLRPTLSRIVHRTPAPRLADGALNPELDWATHEKTYLDSTPQVVVIDDFLRPEALAALRRYCLESTVWKTPRAYGYMGALIGDGFASPLLLQIVAEMRKRLAGILAPHSLAQAWAYKYDSTLRGINIHADCAAVNVNFWITPDDANLDPASGGLVVWDQPPPADWGLLRTQNPDKTEILQYLQETGARAVKVPHRQNRMVLFNSALFHKTDDTSFREGYENRRINVTLLYGNGLR
jgi:tetratricopeptide (TPR) repeat protein